VWEEEGDRMARKTKEQRQQERRDAEASYGRRFLARLADVKTYAEAKVLAYGDAPDDPGRLYHTNLVHVLGTNEAAGRSTLEERAAHLALIERLVAGRELQPEAVEQFKRPMERSEPIIMHF